MRWLTTDGNSEMKTRTTIRTILAALAALAWAGNVFAGPLTVDGRLDDWGVRVGDNNTSNISVPLAPSSVTAGPLACFGSGVCEDQNDLSNNHALGPHWGGQDYDVEFLGVRFQSGRIFIGIASGLRPDNGLSLYGPGDLFLRVNGAAYAIEIGGGVGGSAASAAPLLGGAAGTTYTLNGSGYTTGIDASHSAAQSAGSIWRASDIDYVTDPIAHTSATQFKLKTGTTAADRVGIADFVFTRDHTPDTVNGGSLAQHSVIELSFDASLFTGVYEIDAYWGPACSNDVLAYSGSVPEPDSLALFALAVGGLGVAARSKNLHRVSTGA